MTQFYFFFNVITLTSSEVLASKGCHVPTDDKVNNL